MLNDRRIRIREAQKHVDSIEPPTKLTVHCQVVRTHPVHPELVCGTFQCLDCQTEIKEVEQQFKYTQPTVCRSAV